jgi:hypothetical protein
VDDAMAEVLRQKTPAQRVEMVLAANRTLRLLVEGHIRTRHPGWDATNIASVVARRMIRGTS